jgi:hypothetical protein
MGGRAGGGVLGDGLRDAERLPQDPPHEGGESLRRREEVEGSHDRVPDGAALRPEEPRAGEGASGLAFFDNGQLGEAFPPLRRYSDRNPDDLEVRQKLGVIYLMGRAPDKAREQAEAILKKKPQDVDAMLLLAESADTPRR